MILWLSIIYLYLCSKKIPTHSCAKADGMYVIIMLSTGFLIVCVYIAALCVAKKKRLENVESEQILFSGLAVLDLISDVNIVYTGIYNIIYIFHVNLYLCNSQWWTIAIFFNVIKKKN